MGALLSWLADGGEVVSPELAQSRGEICIGCPQNVPGNWWDENFKEPIAAVIKSQLEIKNRIKIGVEAEKEVGMCRACGCCLRLKIHEPIKYILEHSSMETISKLDQRCWVLHEPKI